MLLFKDLKANYPIYILDRQKVTFLQGVVKEVSFPHVDSTNKTIGFNGIQPMVVDITVDVGGQSATYVIPDNLSLAYVGGNSTILSTDKESLAREIEAMKMSSEQAIASIDHHKEVIEKASKLLSEISPAYHDKAKYEERFNQLENGMGEMKEMLSRLVNELKS